MCGKDYSWHPTTFGCESGEYLASTIVDSAITCDEIIGTADIVSTNVICTVSTNAANIVSINFDDKKVRYNTIFFILHTVLLMVVLLFIINIIFCHYAKHRSKHKLLTY